MMKGVHRFFLLALKNRILASVVLTLLGLFFIMVPHTTHLALGLATIPLSMEIFGSAIIIPHLVHQIFGLYLIIEAFRTFTGAF
jgi:hypothetical protein